MGRIIIDAGGKTALLFQSGLSIMRTVTPLPSHEAQSTNVSNECLSSMPIIRIVTIRSAVTIVHTSCCHRRALTSIGRSLYLDITALDLGRTSLETARWADVTREAVGASSSASTSFVTDALLDLGADHLMDQSMQKEGGGKNTLTDSMAQATQSCLLHGLKKIGRGARMLPVIRVVIAPPGAACWMTLAA